MKGTIRKTETKTDYINFRSGRVQTGFAFEVNLEDGLEMWLPASWGKKKVADYIAQIHTEVELEMVA